MRKATLGIAGCLVIAVPLAPRQAPVPLVRLAPASTGTVKQAFRAPPDTAFCKANFGVACYQPAQIRKAGRRSRAAPGGRGPEVAAA